MKDWYRISGPQLRELVHDSLKLIALENGGVDNWEWYSESLHEFLTSENADGEHEGFYEIAEHDIEANYEPIEFKI